MRPGEGSRNDAHAAYRSIVADLSPGAEHACPVDHRPVAAAGLVRVWNLPDVGAVLDRIFGPRAQHQPDLLLENLSVFTVRRRVVGQRGDATEVLPKDVGPTRLIAAREPDEAAASREVIQNRRLFRDPYRILGAHDVAQLADP